MVEGGSIAHEDNLEDIRRVVSREDGELGILGDGNLLLSLAHFQDPSVPRLPAPNIPSFDLDPIENEEGMDVVPAAPSNQLQQEPNAFTALVFQAARQPLPEKGTIN
ncbi:hypothetical protein JCGZ_24125 [Jatropha curcas]|uniref:Uncharacterized protein n=1 Tax=Jatropha curcas TaxID=180498 RepID=A0A067L5H1_JATCU|nr:hypothetical protein JCGZ_24125 [Jatropha curcas]